MEYVKKKDGTIIESQCQTVYRNMITTMLQNKTDATDFFLTYSGDDLTGILEYDATKNITTCVGMFDNCRNLRKIPVFNISKVKSVNSMFYGCYRLIESPALDYSNVITMIETFKYCTNLTSPSLVNTSNVTNISEMFVGCSLLKNIPLFDTSAVTNIYDMFYNCYNLISIPKLDFSNVNQTVGDLFYGCSNLEEIHFTGLKVSFNISASTNFTEAALVEILNNLGTPTSSQTLTMGATNLAKLTDEEKAIATDKGWTLK